MKLSHFIQNDLNLQITSPDFDLNAGLIKDKFYFYIFLLQKTLAGYKWKLKVSVRFEFKDFIQAFLLK